VTWSETTEKGEIFPSLTNNVNLFRLVPGVHLTELLLFMENISSWHKKIWYWSKQTSLSCQKDNTIYCLLFCENWNRMYSLG